MMKLIKKLLFSLLVFASVLALPQALGVDQTKKESLSKKYFGDLLIYKANINTPYSESSPIIWEGDKLVFMSNRKKAKKNKRVGTFDLYYASLTDKLNKFHKPVILKKGMKTSIEEGPATFTGDGSAMIYTQSPHKVPIKNHRFHGDKQLVLTEYNYFIDEWEKSKRFLVDSLYGLKHSALSVDGRTLFFASNHPYKGHKGGNDLYMIKQDIKGEWSSPINLGDSINTIGDEGFPFQHHSGRLYFASDGHKGLGNLDILFSVPDNKGLYTNVYNLGKPINSKYDDFGIAFDIDMNTGYFTSDRPGGDGMDDIYVIKIDGPDLIIAGLVLDQVSNKPIKNVLVKLKNHHGEIIDSIKTNVNGVYRFPINHEEKYTITALSRKFGVGELSFKSEKKIGKSVRKDLLLAVNEEKETPIHQDTIKQLIAFPINFNFNQHQILENQNPKLNKLIDILMLDTTIIVSITSYSDCRGPEEYNLDLSKKRALSTKEYLISQGVNAEQVISYEGKGELNPIVACDCSGGTKRCNEKEHRLNRRSEFVLKKFVIQDDK